jgi:hypothetical protein
LLEIALKWFIDSAVGTMAKEGRFRRESDEMSVERLRFEGL